MKEIRDRYEIFLKVCDWKFFESSRGAKLYTIGNQSNDGRI